MSSLTFEPPGPGTWIREPNHVPRPLSRYFQSFYPDEFERGFNEGAKLYGLPVDLKAGLVHGYWYMGRRRVSGLNGEVDTASDELQHRVEQATEAFKTKRWRADLQRWDEKWRPALEAKNRSLLSVDPTAFEDFELTEHLDKCHEAAREAVYYHHRLTLADFIPRGDFIAFAVEHTGRPAGDIVRVFTGTSPGSVDVVTDLQPLARAIEESPQARERLDAAQDPPGLIDEFRSRDDVVGELMREWLMVAGHRLVTGYDVANVTGIEQPETLVSTLRAAIDGDLSVSVDVDAELADLRAAVPADQRSAFDERFEEARRLNRFRDERSLMDNWTLGITRRGLLAAGRRFMVGGQLRDSEHVVDLTHDELVTALRGGPMPGAAEVAVHARHRTTANPSEAPTTLGPEPSGPPSPDLLPDPVARSMIAWNSLMSTGGPDLNDDVANVEGVQGYPASPGLIEGRARVVTGPSEFGAIEAGDILVAEATSSAFNVILPLLGAIVTDHGGTLSHPAIVAREFGIPAVVGSQNATTRISDGDRVMVDGDEGMVRVLE